MAADGQGPPFPVSIPIRYSPDGRSWGEGIVTSLSTSNLVVQTSVPPEVRSRVFFALGIGSESTFHGEGRVTTPPSPAPGEEPVPGFGLRFEGTPSELAAAIAKLERAYPGAVGIEADGSLEWPVRPEGVQLPSASEGEGLTLWVEGQEAGQVDAGAAPSTTTGNGNAPLPAYVAMLRGLAGAIASCTAERVVLSHRGRVLAPGSGIPTRILDAGLRAMQAALPAVPAASVAAASASSGPGTWSLDVSDFDEPTAEVGGAAMREDEEGPSEVELLWDHPLLEFTAAQMRVIDTLSLAQWRYQRLTPELVQSLDRDRTLLDGINLRIATSADESGLDEAATSEIAQAVEDVGALVERSAWHSTAIESLDASGSFYETFQIEKERLARQAVVASRAAAREAREAEDSRPAAGKPEPQRRDREEPRKAEPKPKPRRDEKPRKEEKPKHEEKPHKEPKRPAPHGDPGTGRSGDPKKAPPWAIAGVVLIAIIAGTRITNAVRSNKPPPPPLEIDVAGLRNDVMRVAPPLQLRDARVEGGQLKLIVDPLWLERPARDRQGDLEAISLPVLSRGFIDFVALTPDGKEAASYHRGKFAMKGVEAPDRSKDSER